MIVHKGATELCLRTIPATAETMTCYSDNGWMNQGLVLRYLREVVVPYADGRQCALILDRFRAHWTQAVVDFAAAHRIHLISVPAGDTSISQPLDVSVNGPLKARARKAWRLQQAQRPDTRLKVADAVCVFEQSYALTSPASISLGFKRALGCGCTIPIPPPIDVESHLADLRAMLASMGIP